MDDFAGKTAIITGGASGIGLGLANRLADARMNIVIADIEDAALERAVEHFQQRQVPVIGVKTNTMIADSVTAMIDQAIERFERVHILCNNAGVASTRSSGPVWDVPAADWDWVLGVNFYGVLYGVQKIVPHMLGHGESSHIVNTASLAGLMTGRGTYGVSKHAVVALSESLALDLAGSSIGVSVLCPGFVKTNIAQAERNRPSDLAASGPQPPELAAEQMSVMAEMLAQGKAPSEVAEIVFQAIENDDFYVLPHPAWDDAVRSRIDQVLDRGKVASVDLEALTARAAPGEQL